MKVPPESACLLPGSDTQRPCAGREGDSSHLQSARGSRGAGTSSCTLLPKALPCVTSGTTSCSRQSRGGCSRGARVCPGAGTSQPPPRGSSFRLSEEQLRVGWGRSLEGRGGGAAEGAGSLSVGSKPPCGRGLRWWHLQLGWWQVPDPMGWGGSDSGLFYLAGSSWAFCKEGENLSLRTGGVLSLFQLFP